MAPRAGEAAHVGDELDARVGKRGDEVGERARAVPDRPDATHRDHCHSHGVSDVTVRAISPAQHDAVMHFFDLVAYADNPNWSKCYCCERVVPDYDDRTKAQNRATRSELIRSAKANGLVAYRLRPLVGWGHPGPQSGPPNVPRPRPPARGAGVRLPLPPGPPRPGDAPTPPHPPP